MDNDNSDVIVLILVSSDECSECSSSSVSPRSRAATASYRSGWDRIFSTSPQAQNSELN